MAQLNHCKEIYYSRAGYAAAAFQLVAAARLFFESRDAFKRGQGDGGGGGGKEAAGDGGGFWDQVWVPRP